MNAGVEPAVRARGTQACVLALALLAILPSLGTLGAPWIAEDASILAQVRADGPWADWGRSQYGMHLLLFWRPLVSTSWALQEALTGIAPLPLRLLNLGLHVGIALLVFASARRLGCGRPAAVLAGAWIALFPDQGGTSTWLAGRTDLLCAFFLLASVATALGPRPWTSLPLAFLAAAAKEFGFLAPLWIGLFVLARDGRGGLRRVVPAVLAAGLAFAWRRLALGQFMGGYVALVMPPLTVGVPAALRTLAEAAWPSLLALGLLALAGLRARTLDGRGLGAALVAAALATGLLYQLLCDGYLEPENRRLLYASECAVALALGTALRGAGARSLPFALGLVLCVPRLADAWRDTHDWARAAAEGEELVARARAAVADLPPGEGPVLFQDFPASLHDAYCLGFGVAARFRPPFPATPRPVWPWRLVFVHAPERLRQPRVAARPDGSLRPLDDAPRLASLALEDLEGRAVARLPVDERAVRAAEDRSPRVRLAGAPPGAPLEALVVTELGYEPVLAGRADAEGRAELSLMGLLTAGNGVVTLADVLVQAADLGATGAWIELRALDAEGTAVASAPWVALEWSADLLERVSAAGSVR